jgi:hypothetical protein
MAGPFERCIGIHWSGAASRSGQRIYVAEPYRQEARITLYSASDALPEEARSREGWIVGVQVPR